MKITKKLIKKRNRRELIQKSANWRVRVLPGKRNQKFQNRGQVTEMAARVVKMAGCVPGQESSKNPANTTIALWKSAKYLETVEGDVGNNVDSKVREIINCVIIAT